MLLNQRFVRFIATMVVACSTIALTTTNATAQTADQLLQQGIEQHEAGQHEDAYNTLRRVDAIQLSSDEHRASLHDTLDDVRAAIALGTRLELAREAETNGNLDHAASLYKAVAELLAFVYKKRDAAAAGGAR